MKSVIVTLTLLLVASLVLAIDASQDKRYNNNALRERLLSYLIQAKREGLLYNQVREIRKPIERHPQYNTFNNENDDDDERTFVRRKGIGLHDDPLK